MIQKGLLMEKIEQVVFLIIKWLIMQISSSQLPASCIYYDSEISDDDQLCWVGYLRMLLQTTARDAFALLKIESGKR